MGLGWGLKFNPKQYRWNNENSKIISLEKSRNMLFLIFFAI